MKAIMIALPLLVAAPSIAQDAGTDKVADGTAVEEAQPDGDAPAEELVSDAVFEDGLAAYQGRAFRSAANKLYEYLAGNEADADHYEWAEFYLARSLIELGLTHAGVEYLYNVAKERKRPELLPEALRELERIIAERPYDRLLLISDLLGSTDFGALPPDVEAFIAYQKGRRDLIAGKLDWAQRHFENLDRLKDQNELASRYLLRAEFAKAVVDVRATHERATKKQVDRRTKARERLEALIDSPVDDPETRNEAAKVVARLFFEEEQYDKALATYERVEVPFLSEEEASIFLEKAWTRYFAGDPRGALGILLSLEAPSYRRYFFPETFVLKALSFQQLCHYAAAKGSAREFLRRYGDAINELRSSRNPLSHPVLRRAAVQTKKPRQTLEFLESLKREREGAEALSDSAGLRTQLVYIYDSKIAQVSQQLDKVVRKAGDKVAADLLDYEEQARLVDYEVSLEVFRRLKRAEGKKVVVTQEPEIPLGGKDVYYRFDVEYWNDELHNYRFRIQDRCFGGELFR